MPKLTLSADEQIIEKAKKLAEDRGTSVSAMFSQYIGALSLPRRRQGKAAPITRRLRGVAKAPAGLSDRQLFERAILGKGRR